METPSDLPTATALDDLLTRGVAGEARAIARAISIVEDRRDCWPQLLEGCRRLGRHALRIGITGAPGAGKSTLAAHLIRLLRQRGETVGVLAVDPSSPCTGGALLGDRIRMAGFSADPGVYIRSLASRCVPGGLGGRAAAVCEVMEAAGFSVLLLETVGAGQDNVAVAALADITLLVLVPGMGDHIQTLKAGIMEIANIFVINESDPRRTARLEADLLAMQALSLSLTRRPDPIVRTNASTGAGVRELIEAIARFQAQSPHAEAAL
jgi:LAO/AO transport system kinase